MADQSTGRNEVEELLKSMGGGEKKKAAPKAATATSPAPEVVEGKPKEAVGRPRVVAYDFKRPERVGKEQMRAMQSLHEGLARNFGASMSALLRSIVEVKLISVDQLTYSEFVYSLEIPTCFNLLRAAPLEGNWILDITPALLYPIIDRMLGGGSVTDTTLKRPLSDIELRLTSRITSAFLRDLMTAWANALELDIEVERVESNPQLVQIVPPNEVVILVSFELAMGKTRGMINLCIPFNTIEHLGPKLSSNTWVSYASSRANPKSQSQIAANLEHAVAELVVTLAHSTIKTGDLFHLQVGDIISTEKDVRAPLEVEVEGVVKFLASPGAYKGRAAVEIRSAIEKAAR